MAMQFVGNDVALQRNATNGRYDLVLSTSGRNVGNPVLDSTRTHAVLVALTSMKRGTRPGSKTPEGGYYADPTGRLGTLLWTVTQDPLATPSQLRAYAEDAGQQLVDKRFIASFKATATRRAPSRASGKFAVYAEWTLPDGNKPPGVSI